MTIALRSTDNAGIDSDTVTITKPAGLTIGDLMIAHVVGRSIITSFEHIVVPEGWTLIVEEYHEGLKWSSSLLWKIADADDVAASDFSFTITGAQSIGGAITAWTGHDSTTPINASSSQHNDASQTVTAPTITPVANCMILMVCGIRDNVTQSDYAIATDNPPSWDEAYDLPMNLYADVGLSIGYALRPETSPTGNGTAKTSGVDINIGQLVAIAPEAVVAVRHSFGFIIG